MPTKMKLKWYEDANILEAARKEYGSLAAAARAIGGASESTVQKAWNRLGGQKLPPGPQPKPPANKEALDRLYRNIYGANGN